MYRRLGIGVKTRYQGAGRITGENEVEVASAIDLPPISFKTQRRRIRDALEQDGVTAQIDSIARMFL